MMAGCDDRLSTHQEAQHLVRPPIARTTINSNWLNLKKREP